MYLLDFGMLEKFNPTISNRHLTSFHAELQHIERKLFLTCRYDAFDTIYQSNVTDIDYMMCR